MQQHSNQNPNKVHIIAYRWPSKNCLYLVYGDLFSVCIVFGDQKTIYEGQFSPSTPEFNPTLGLNSGCHACTAEKSHCSWSGFILFLFLALLKIIFKFTTSLFLNSAVWGIMLIYCIFSCCSWIPRLSCGSWFWGLRSPQWEGWISFLLVGAP